MHEKELNIKRLLNGINFPSELRDAFQKMPFESQVLGLAIFAHMGKEYIIRDILLKELKKLNKQK